MVMSHVSTFKFSIATGRQLVDELFIDFHSARLQIEEGTPRKSRYRRNFKRRRASIGMGQVKLLRLEWSRHVSSFLRFIEADQ
jgi:hypothetical protein